MLGSLNLAGGLLITSSTYPINFSDLRSRSRSPELRNLSKVVGVYSETVNARKFKLGMEVVYDKVYISHRF